MKDLKTLLVVLILGYIGLVAFGVLPNPLVGTGTGTGTSIQPPVSSDLQSTVNFLFKDKLATTETKVNATWYCFNGEGTFFDSGTASTSGVDSMTAGVNTNYDCYAYVADPTGAKSETAGSGGYLVEKFPVVTGTGAPVSKTVTLLKSSGIEIYGMDDPLDFNSNISGTAGATEKFRLKYGANVTKAVIGRPIAAFTYNKSTTVIEDITSAGADNLGGTYTEISCPSRLTVKILGNKLKCFQRDKDVYSTDGTVIAEFSIKLGSTGPGDMRDKVNLTMLDSGMYLTSGFTTVAGIIDDVAQTDQATDVGAGDDTCGTGAEVLGFGG